MPQTNIANERINYEGPECPNCGEVVYAGDVGNDTTGEIDCGACGETFFYEIECSYTYTTYIKKG